MSKQTVSFDYFHGCESEQFAFYRIPKVLFTNDYFKGLSSDAKVLYGLMLDRMALSVRNHWIDDRDRVYIIFTLEQVMEYMNCGKDKGVKILAELDAEKGIGLIERVKRGLGKPTIIYVKSFLVKEKPVCQEAEPEAAVSALESENADLPSRSPEFGKAE
ncbi:MAG: replication initiator protein A, partial [Eubacteriales bacterium]|nr:replication initiator protein A [Eubacteriales bacterium]